MYLPTLFVLFACTWISSSSSLVVFIRTDQGVSSGILNLTTGIVSHITPYNMPPTQGTWDFGSGTRGQTSAVFPMNSTYFFVAQERLHDGSVGRTLLTQSHGPSGPPLRTVPLQTQSPLSGFNLAWDHTCNIVVLIPEVGSDSHSIVTKQVSEYDGQVRPQADYLPPTNGDFWTKVEGLGALDAGDYHSSWPTNEEWNCGDKCVLYTLEQTPVSGAPRALIGKSFRTGKVMSNQTDSLQLQTLSWSPFGRKRSSEFVGIGVCGSASWVHPSCKGLEGHTILAHFVSTTKKLTILSDIGDQVDPDTVRLGVEFSQGTANPQAYVYYKGSVITYSLTLDATTNGILKVTQVSTSPKVDHPLQYWFASYPWY